MHFMKGTATYVYLMIAILAAALTLAAAQEETPAPEPAPAPMKCFQCTSKENENCLDVSKLSATECTDDTFIKCYTKNDAGIITRGCLGKDDTTTCPAEGCKSCTPTADGGCNNQNICKKCSTDDANCSQTDASDAKYNDICDSSTAQCYVNVTDKKVERRCAASSDACADGTTTTCNKCSGVNCNAGIFPKDRIECYQCSGANCVDTTSLSTKPCANYVAADECFMFPDDAKTVTRGCKSDDSSKCADSAKEGCQTCTETKCNNWKYDTEFKCIVCRSDIDARCWNKADELSGSTCRNGDSSIEDGCFHGIWNGVAIRGCYIDADEKTKVTCSDKENKQCEVCNTGANCNKEKSSGAGSVTIFMGLVVTMISAIWYLN